MDRENGIDAIKVVLTLLVIVHHVSIVYGGAGGWYWKDVDTQNIYLVAFNAINQSYFMGFFFLLSGYFSRFSIDTKGSQRFLYDRIIRLGLPLFTYFFVISPFAIALANPAEELSLLDQTFRMMKRGEFEPGPLWFVLALLVMSFVLVVTYRFLPTGIGAIKNIPKVSVLVVVLVLVGVIAFIVRMIIPVGQTYMWLQLGYFPMYILLFLIGFFAFPNRVLSTIKFSTIKPWLLVSLLAILALFIVIFMPLGSGSFDGGWNMNALFYAVWEPFCACGVIMGMLYYFNHRSNTFIRWLCMASPLAYCMYIIHPPIVIATSIFIELWDQNPMIKLLINACISILACVSLSYVIVKLPYARRVL